MSSCQREPVEVDPHDRLLLEQIGRLRVRPPLGHFRQRNADCRRAIQRPSRTLYRARRLVFRRRLRSRPARADCFVQPSGRSSRLSRRCPLTRARSDTGGGRDWGGLSVGDRRDAFGAIARRAIEVPGIPGNRPQSPVPERVFPERPRRRAVPRTHPSRHTSRHRTKRERAMPYIVRRLTMRDLGALERTHHLRGACRMLAAHT